MEKQIFVAARHRARTTLALVLSTSLVLTMATLFLRVEPIAAQATTPTQVNIQNFAFQPGDINIPVGTIVHWTNLDTVPHTVTSDTGVWSSPTLAQNQSYEFTFTTPGTYPYHCTIHSHMVARIVVAQVASPTSEATATTAATATAAMTATTAATATTAVATATTQATATIASPAATATTATTVVTATAEATAQPTAVTPIETAIAAPTVSTVQSGGIEAANTPVAVGMPRTGATEGDAAFPFIQAMVVLALVITALGVFVSKRASYRRK